MEKVKAHFDSYICNYGKMAKPLTELTTDKFGRDISHAWKADPKYQQAFDALKEKLCEYPVLRLPDLSKPYVCCSDASDYALGAALCQEIDRKLGVTMTALADLKCACVYMYVYECTSVRVCVRSACARAEA
jgi:hypothetical protein